MTVPFKLNKYTLHCDNILKIIVEDNRENKLLLLYMFTINTN